jgi:hypothetical protein
MSARMWGKGNSYTLMVKMYMSTNTMKTIWRTLKKLKIELKNNPAFPFLGIQAKEYKSCYNKGSCTFMFIAPLFTISKLWKMSRCPTTGKSIKNMWYFIYNGILLSHKEE